MDTKSPIVNYPTPPTTSHNISTFSFNIKSDSGSYPYNYSPTINNCIPTNLSSKDNSNKSMNMNNYNNINMYNTASIITNNNGSSFSTPNSNSQGTNNYQASSQASKDTSNYNISSLSSYSNINYTNINPSIQPLSPKEISQVFVEEPQSNGFQNYDKKTNPPSEQNYINYNTYSNPNQIENGSPAVNNMIDNNNKFINKNEQKLSIDTTLSNSSNDTQSSFYNYSNPKNDSFDIKTPTSVNNQKSSGQVNTPPMTPVQEKNKKKRGDHIHYNIKTNMFTETQQYYEVYDFEKTKSYNLKIIPKVDRGFFPTGPEKDFTCYRRNYFQISVSFSADNIKSPSEFTTPCLLKVGNEYLNIENFYVGICAKVKNSNKEIRVVQQTAKREKGPQNKPVPKLCKPGGNSNYYHGLTSNQSIVTFERLQFKSATPSSSKRATTQQFYALVIELFADTPERRYKIATIESKRLIVRGRSPGHYQNNSAYDDPSLSGDAIESTGSYYDNNGFNNSSSENTPTSNNGTNYNGQYNGEQNVNFMNPNNGHFNPANSMDSSFQPNNGQNANNSFNPYIFNNNRNSFDSATPSTYPEENGTPGMNYQNNVPSNTGSFYPIKDINTPLESPAQNGYMYQTPPLPPQQTPQPINPYNVPKQDIVNPYTAENQNSYSPYVQGQVPTLFQSQPSQPSPPQAYSSDGYYPQNPNQNAQVSSQPIPQNVNNPPQSSYYSSNNQDIIFTNPANPFPQPPAQQNSNQTSAPSPSVNGNYTVPAWTTNGAF
ncbi:hypothetical protein PIROE2DRAFT_12008 [Piromyces sp. E2]|nr:hypothetical protein PIROE2DRAFT_12008 [Piromyces sp. E2]|eukprot:OUM61893.1 hypothetical protein PIROE2DRAFT_12008 [Piromyces sp. E2]